MELISASVIEMGEELILANLWISSDYFLHFLTQVPFLFPHTDPSGGLVPASTHKVLVLLQRPHVGNGCPSKNSYSSLEEETVETAVYQRGTSDGAS